MDRQWMKMHRMSVEYDRGVEEFLRFGMSNNGSQSIMYCPCVKCGNSTRLSVEEIRDHLFVNGIDQCYTKWIWHGEPATIELPTKARQRAKDINFEFELKGEDHVNETVNMVYEAQDGFIRAPDKFYKALNDAEKPLYPDCDRYTRLSSIVKLYNLKAKYGWSDTSFGELLSLLSDMLPVPNEMINNMYEAKKTLRTLGMSYEKIHACPNDCVLYRKELESAVCCPTCGISRWKTFKDDNSVKDGVPAKSLWYFSPIPRFRRMFRNATTAKDLRWHHLGRAWENGKMVHPADSPSWNLIDHTWPEFARDPRNLRLAISADGINPHSTMSTTYSCWPVVMVIYNLPPWMCMKRKFMMLTLLISGPSQPGNDIDVYLAPLIDDLKILWHEGIECYDAYSDESFLLKAVLLWTINDFPAYGNLSGCATKGYKACPICGDDTDALWLENSKTCSYMGHRKFLPTNHPFRRQKKAFNGEQELNKKKGPLCGDEILEIVEQIPISFGKKGKKKKGDVFPINSAWKKKSIFFNLEYWKSLHVRHCLDVMHIEKNICMNLIGTLLDVPGKSRDGLKARLDLQAMGIRQELIPEKGMKRTYLPPACYTLSRVERAIVCRNLSNLKVPEGYGSNFRNLVSLSDLKVSGMKSHDCHTLMQQLLPIVMRSVLPNHVQVAIVRLCAFFNELCSKVVDIPRLDQLQNEIVVTLCLLEKLFPPTFFTIMMHLTVHLVREVRLCGPVHYRWMYPFERFMKVLKNYVRNRRYPEGTISECYTVEEALDYCSGSLSGVSPIGIPQNPRDAQQKPLSAGSILRPSRSLLMQAHRYILANSSLVENLVKQHQAILALKNPRLAKKPKQLMDLHNRSFDQWIRNQVDEMLSSDINSVEDTVRWLAHGPQEDVIAYSGWNVNGTHYCTKKRDDTQVVQNSGVSVVSEAMQFASAKDKNPLCGEMQFYGVIQDIWEIDYLKFKIPVFRCDWVDNKNGIKKDSFGFTLVDLNRLGHRDDQFVLTDQAIQVFYVSDALDTQWKVVLSSPKRDCYGSRDEDEVGDPALERVVLGIEIPSIDATNEDEPEYARVDCVGAWIENNL